VSRIEDLIQKLAPRGITFKTLGDVGEFVRGNGLQKSDLIDEGTPAIHYGQIHTFYGTWAEETVSFTSPSLAARLRRARTGDLVIATTSEDDTAVAKAVAWLGVDEAAVSGDAYIFRHSLDPKYVAYFFQSAQFQGQKMRNVTGTKVRRISGDALSKIRIPVPPVEVQHEIVRILDLFGGLRAELEAEMLARRQQYAHYRSALLAGSGNSSTTSTLGAICSQVLNGGTPLSTRRDFYNGNIPWLRTQEVRYADILDTEVKITQAGLDGSAARWVPANSVIVAISGAGVTRGRVAVNKIPLTTNQHCCSLVIDPAKANYRYVYYWLVDRYEELRSQGQGNRSDLNLRIVKAFPIELPSLEGQERVVTVLDEMNALTNDVSCGIPAEIDVRRKQFEYYRDKLMTFKERAA
jgi:type I restriction enzyme S subunit